MISGLLVGLAFLSLGLRGLRLGPDFTGDAVFEIEYKNSAQKDVIEKAWDGSGLGGAEINQKSDRRFVLRTRYLSQDEHEKALGTLRQTGDLEEKSFSATGPSVGRQLRRNALLAVIFSLMAIIVYIAFAFRKVSRPISSWIYGVIAIVALLHDIIIPMGLFSFLRFEIDALFISALLTLLGFSVHDTIVVFDRVRENLRRDSHGHFDEIVEKSLHETIGRSINTSLSTLFALVAVFVFGGASTQHLALALISGIIVGTYSSIFIASTLLVSVARFREK